MISAHVRQKFKGRHLPYVAATVWSIYLGADWVATLAMTTILRGTLEKESAVVVLWVPFLLWHLGSPANITAYSLEDNELWLRHFLGLVSNGAEAVYIYFKFRTAGVPIYGSLHFPDVMVVPLLVGGILKYAERIVALRSACSEQLRSALYSEAENNQRESEEREMIRTGLYESAGTVKQFAEDPQVKFLQEARKSFEIFRPLFLDLPFKVSRNYLNDNVYLKKKSAKQAFRLVKIELQFFHDLLFTKNPIQYRHRKLNAFLRGFYILSALSVLIVLSTQNHIGVNKRDITGLDIAVTYLLLVGAILLDVLGALLHLLSYWTMTEFGIAGGKLYKLYHWLVASRLRSIKSMAGTPKIAQYDLLKEFCSKRGIGIFSGLINLIDTNELRNKYRIISWVELEHYLEEFIYTGLEKERLNPSLSAEVLRIIGEDASLQPLLELGKGARKGMPAGLTRVIFVFHIATKLIYYNAVQRGRPVRSSSCRISNILSDYMLYLVLVHPTMLPKDFGDTTKESFVPEKRKPDLIRKESQRMASTFSEGGTLDTTAAISGLLGIRDAEVFFSFELTSNSSLTQVEVTEPNVLVGGLDVAQQLQELLDQFRYDYDDIWEIVSDIWMKMLIHAAKYCSWKEHAVALRQGGELLTYVSLLSAHFGLSQYIEPS
ncbi:hypothetical protein Goshw_000521 [Gossypium schwendimanii]|uniref:DUF4220 domain-containing protein n=1 Tax=Gossypium schwendimanii TaxID=34291 RepID=A0A7J9KPP9_GOSSC|nr:hypothetical protein [Gossypium schwendimanii]